MQAFGNVATLPERKVSKVTGKGYYEFRIAESHRGVDLVPTWYTVRMMRDDDPFLEKGDFVKVTGKLKVDFYMGKDAKPSGTLLIIAFDASKISKPEMVIAEVKNTLPEPLKPKQSAPVQLQVQAPLEKKVQQQRPVAVAEAALEQETDWTTLYQ